MKVNEYLPNLDVEAPVWLDALERFCRPWQKIAFFRPFSNVISINTSHAARKNTSDDVIAWCHCKSPIIDFKIQNLNLNFEVAMWFTPGFNVQGHSKSKGRRFLELKARTTELWIFFGEIESLDSDLYQNYTSSSKRRSDCVNPKNMNSVIMQKVKSLPCSFSRKLDKELVSGSQ
jgi:hypothetical protein